MPDSTILFYIAAELAFLLLLVCVYLLFHVAKINKINRAFENKIIELGSSKNEEGHSDSDKQDATVPPQSKQFLDFIDEELIKTKEHHQSFSPSRDIVLDIGLDAPVERQTVSLRHAFLISEKEACCAGDSPSPSWDILQSKLQQIIQFYLDAISSQSDQNKAQSIAEASGEPVKGAIDQTAVSSIHAKQQEIQRLSHLAADYSKVMDDLKNKLNEAETPEQHKEIIAALSVEIEQHHCLLQEAEACADYIESDLANALQENEELRSQLGVQPSSDAESVQLINLQQELLDLQGQYIELEERYLEAKAK